MCLMSVYRYIRDNGYIAWPQEKSEGACWLYMYMPTPIPNMTLNKCVKISAKLDVLAQNSDNHGHNSSLNLQGTRIDTNLQSWTKVLGHLNANTADHQPNVVQTIETNTDSLYIIFTAGEPLSTFMSVEGATILQLFSSK